MNFKKWLSENILWVIVTLLAVNFLVVYWGTVNLGLYSARSSILGWNTLRPRKLLLQDKLQAAEDDVALLAPGQGSGTVSSANLRLTCSDDDAASAFAAVRPAVVNITADKVTQNRGGSLTTSVAFDDPAITFVEEQSLGSGIIVDSRGYVITNAHVASKSRDIKVVTFGFERTTYPAEVVYKDLENDIAVLKIYPRTPLPTAVLGDSDMVRVADRVLAVGSPFGLEQTVTAGIISDDSRDLVIENQLYKDMLQTDAAINRGNSGGALINMKGEVIGINTAIYAPTGVFTGVGFAIRINVVKTAVKKVASR